MFADTSFTRCVTRCNGWFYETFLLRVSRKSRKKFYFSWNCLATQIRKSFMKKALLKRFCFEFHEFVLLFMKLSRNANPKKFPENDHVTRWNSLWNLSRTVSRNSFTKKFHRVTRPLIYHYFLYSLNCNNHNQPWTALYFICYSN